MAGAVPEHRQVRLPELRDAGDRERSQRGAVVGPVPGDDLVPALVATRHVIVAGELDGRLDRFGAGANEERLVQVPRGETGDHGRRLDGRRVGETPVGGEGQRLHLAGGHGSQVGPTVADVHTEQACQAIEVLVAVAVVEVAALTSHDDRQGIGVPSPLLREVGHEVLLRQFPRRTHVFSRWLPTDPPAVRGRTLPRTVQ